MCFSKGMMGCCCMQCTYLLKDWIDDYTVELVEEYNASRLSWSDTIVTDDGSPIRCTGNIRNNKAPCIEVAMSSENNSFAVSAPADSYYSRVATVLWFGRWVPDGLYHTFGGYVDTSARMIYTRNLSGSVVRDWDYERDGIPVDPNITYNAFQAALIYVRQGSELYYVGMPGDGSYRIVEDDVPQYPPAWNRVCESAAKPYNTGRVWSQVPGVDYGSGYWWRVRADSDPLKPYSMDEWATPDNTEGAPDWELGIGITQGALNSPSSGGSVGSSSWEPFDVKGRIDNFCLRIDPPT